MAAQYQNRLEAFPELKISMPSANRVAADTIQVASNVLSDVQQNKRQSLFSGNRNSHRDLNTDRPSRTREHRSLTHVYQPFPLKTGSTNVPIPHPATPPRSLPPSSDHERIAKDDPVRLDPPSKPVTDAATKLPFELHFHVKVELDNVSKSRS